MTTNAGAKVFFPLELSLFPLPALDLRSVAARGSQFALLIFDTIFAGGGALLLFCVLALRTRTHNQKSCLILRQLT